MAVKTAVRPGGPQAGAGRVNGSQIPLPPPGGLPTRQRRPGYIALLVVLVVGLALVGGWLYTSAGAKTTVLVLARDVPAGQVIARADLTTGSIAGDVHAIAAAQVDTVVGQRAVVELLPGTVLQGAMIGPAGKMTPGTALVGLQLPPGALPAAGVTIGDAVRVYRLADKSATTAADPVLVAEATVAAALPDPSRQGGFLVTVSVPQDLAAAVAAAGGAGAAVLIQVAGS